ncbi:MAG: type II toxin-antitoxin system Phd/YefM family antitoxin [Chloroflexi bacterium]|nr:type II toxin-antitoxin system Phd/YefM family antitoxin [Chloroflexota bacterium]
MARHYNGSQRTITATELRRNFSVVVRRLCQKREHTVIESSGAPVAVILSMAEYDKLTARRRAKSAFYDLSHNLGREVEKLGMTEEEFMADLEKTKRRVFSEQYGRPA